MSRKTGFTLVELLIVIAVLAILMAILLPALSRVKDQARLVICGSNQRQLIFGLTLYANSNGGKLPPSPSHLGSRHIGNLHRPFELNWYGNVFKMLSDAELADPGYRYAGRYLSSYLPDVKVFNCPLSRIKDSTLWPPPTSGSPPQGTYGEFYRSGRYSNLHSTYMLLWNYHGYNHQLSSGVEKALGHFEAPRTVSDKNKLVVQDSLFYLTSNTNILWPSPTYSWYSCHPFKQSVLANPYYTLSAPGLDSPAALKDPKNRPYVHLNAGYLDGRVERFKSSEAIPVKNKNAPACLAPHYR